MGFRRCKKRLFKLLVPMTDVDDKVRMRQVFHERGYDRPPEVRVAEFWTQIKADPDWEEKLVKKWARLGT